jgi:pimeloyl-ACP methyl ester carboxylesterase
MDTLTVRNGNINLHVYLDGDGPTALLLHGWPDTSALWNDVVPLLVDAGFRVAVPDLRGCGRSDKPSGVDDYRMRNLVGDVVSIIDALGGSKVILVGHDWGAALAWAVATFRADLVERLVVLSVGHPSAFYGAGISQQIKSWYMLLFQFEGVGEAFLRKNDYEAIRRWTSHPRPDAVIEELERDGQMRAHLLWYRANVAPDAFVRPGPALPLIEMPVLGIWSSGDFALTEHQMTSSERHCANEFRYVRIEGAGHWIPLEAAASVSREIVNFCSIT